MKIADNIGQLYWIGFITIVGVMLFLFSTIVDTKTIRQQRAEIAELRQELALTKKEAEIYRFMAAMAGKGKLDLLDQETGNQETQEPRN